MNTNCKIHDFAECHNHVYRCKQCGLLELAGYFLSDISIKHYGSRDGWMTFPEGFFDKKRKVLTGQQVKMIRSCLESIRFEEW